MKKLTNLYYIEVTDTFGGDANTETPDGAVYSKTSIRAAMVGM